MFCFLSRQYYREDLKDEEKYEGLHLQKKYVSQADQKAAILQALKEKQVRMHLQALGLHVLTENRCVCTLKTDYTEIVGFFSGISIVIQLIDDL